MTVTRLLSTHYPLICISSLHISSRFAPRRCSSQMHLTTCYTSEGIGSQPLIFIEPHAESPFAHPRTCSESMHCRVLVRSWPSHRKAMISEPSTLKLAVLRLLLPAACRADTARWSGGVGGILMGLFLAMKLDAALAPGVFGARPRLQGSHRD